MITITQMDVDEQDCNIQIKFPAYRELKNLYRL